jgi:dolichyl-phosphooligosaccharide-protein glycotransferase
VVFQNIYIIPVFFPHYTGEYRRGFILSATNETIEIISDRKEEQPQKEGKGSNAETFSDNSDNKVSKKSEMPDPAQKQSKTNDSTGTEEGKNDSDPADEKSGRIQKAEDATKEKWHKHLTKHITRKNKEPRHDAREAKHKHHEHKEQREKKGDDSPVSFDLASAKKFMIRYGFLLVLLIPIILSAYIRVQPWHLDVTDNWARSSVYNMLKSNLRSQVDLAYPNLPEANKQTMVDEKFNEIIAKGSINYMGQDVSIEQIISDNSKQFKTYFQDENGHTYLLGLDEYFWYRIAGEVVEYGHQGNTEKDGKYYDGFILAGAPLEQKGGNTDKTPNLHVWLLAHSYMIIHKYDPNISLMDVDFFIPAIIGSLAVIPAFFIGRKIAGNVAGLFSGLVVALHPVFLSRSVAGTPDTDVYVITLALFVAWLFMEACDAKRWQSSVALSVLAGFFAGLFAFTWMGWFFVFEILMVVFAAYFAYKAIVRLLRDREKGGSGKGRRNLLGVVWNDSTKDPIIATAVLAISSAVFVSLFTSFTLFMELIQDTISFTKLKEVATTTVWPNVLTTVAELNPSQLGSTIAQISYSSKILMFLALCGIAASFTIRRKGENADEDKAGYSGLAMVSISALYYMIMMIFLSSITSVVVFSVLISIPPLGIVLYMLAKKQDIDIKYGVLVLVWFGVGVYSSTKGVRFVMLLVPAFAIALGAAVGWIYIMLRKLSIDGLHINKYVAGGIALLLVLILIIYPIDMFGNAKAHATGQAPLINDVWYEALNKIEAESQPDAIINSWWDFGHWFAAIAQRPVTLDGGRQNSPQAVWLGRLMLTANEDESVGILRMLDCGGNTGFDKLLEYKNQDSVAAINLEYSILPIHNRTDAKKVLLKNGLTDSQAEDVLASTHCSPPEDFFITSEDMVGKSGVWAHFGAWNMTRASMYMNTHDKNMEDGVRILMDNFSLNRTEAESYYQQISTNNADQWVSSWPSYASGLSGCTEDSENIVCNTGICLQNDASGNCVYWVKTSAINKATKETKMTTNANVELVPASVTYFDGKKITEKKFENKSFDVSVILIGQSGSYQAVLSQPLLASSMFTRLFYFRGEGISHFKQFYSNMDVTGADIIVWKIDWEGKEKNSVYQKDEPLNVDFDADSFAKCLDKKNATMYGTSWCTHCQNQKRMLNNSKYIPFVDCEDATGGADKCTEQGITGYPSWIIGSGLYEGEQSPETLANLTGCKIRKIQAE